MNVPEMCKMCPSNTDGWCMYHDEISERVEPYCKVAKYANDFHGDKKKNKQLNK